MNATAFHGLNIHWGISSSVAGVTGIPQSLEGDVKQDTWTGRDGRGVEVAYNGYNPVITANFEFYAADNNSAAGNANVSGSYPERSTMFAITGDSPGNPFALTNWIVEDILIRETNTDATKVTLKATAYQFITS